MKNPNIETKRINWLISTIGKRGYIADYLREASPASSKIIGTGADLHTPGFMSCDKSYLMPLISDDSYLEKIMEIVEREKIDAIITVSDIDVEQISGLRDKLNNNGVYCFFPPQQTALRFLDKYETYKFLNSNNFLTPRTFNSLKAALDNLKFPFIIKPSKGSASNGYRVIFDSEEARSHWSKIQEPIAQEFIEGKLVNIEACSSTSGKILGLSAWERKISIQGETLLAETIIHPAAINEAVRLLEISPIPGPIDIDMIETVDGIYTLEVNTRFGGGYPTSHLAGANFPKLMAMEILDPDATMPLIQYQANVMMMKKLTPISYNENLVFKL